MADAVAVVDDLLAEGVSIAVYGSAQCLQSLALRTCRTAGACLLQQGYARAGVVPNTKPVCCPLIHTLGPSLDLTPSTLSTETNLRQ